MSVSRESPLHYGTADVAKQSCNGAGIVICERAHMGHLNLRGNPEDELFCGTVNKVLGVDLPVEPGTCLGSDECRLHWLGPNEWLVIVAGGQEAELEARLRQELVGHFSVVDVSGGQTVLRLSGEAAGMVLKKSSLYDFHPRQFSIGRCVQTTFAKASALVSMPAENRYDLVLRRSYSDYLFHWIIDAASEYGIEVRSNCE